MTKGVYSGWTYVDWPYIGELDVRKPGQVNANATQEGGTHYKKLAIQPWDYIAANGIGYFEGCIIKYVTRWKDKGGIGDLKKARHFLDKLIELHAQESANK